MQKRIRRHRTSPWEFDMHDLLAAAIRDITPEIGRELSGYLSGWLTSDPSGFRDALSGSLQTAESSLEVAEGGGFRTYVALRQLQALVKKVPDWFSRSKDEREEAALAKFRDAEQACKRANKRLAFYRRHWSRGGKLFPVRVLNTASLLVQEILGPLDHDVKREILDKATFGSGATFRHKSGNTSAYYKLEGNHSITERALPHLREWMALSPRIHGLVKDQKLEVVKGNRISHVDKDWDISRVIAIEPSWNVFLQLGLNGYLKPRLKKFGLDLGDQTLGWKLAREGSIDGSFATLDLSSASDTVSIEIARWLLPKPWFELLNDLRSPEFLADGEWTTYHKFSSMGNGFTFPLETIIFYALAKATARELGAGRQRVVVYGDDIVVPKALFCPLSEVLRFSGFTPNLKKSYGFGHFRETCGRDFLQGVNIRPVYLRKVPRSARDVYSLYNRLWTFCPIKMPHTLRYLRGLIPNPEVGPGFTGRTFDPRDVDLERDRVPLWRRDSHRFEAYYFDDPPETKLWSNAYQTPVYVYTLNDRKAVVDRKANDEYLRYLLFLLGVEGGTVVDPRFIKHFKRTDRTTVWPSLSEVRLHGLVSLQT